MSALAASPLNSDVSDDRIPLSLPAILRNPKAPVAAHLHQPARQIGKKKNVSSGGRPEPTKRWEGKRWTRRRDNDLLAYNPHLTLPTRSDVSLHPSTLPTPTFPTPLPAHLLPRTRPAPSPSPIEPDPSSALAGTFSLSLKGIRRTLRKRGARSEELVRIVEEELERWEQEVRANVVKMRGLNGGGAGRIVDAYPVSSPERTSVSGGETVGGLDAISRQFEEGDGTCPAIVEVARTEASLTWSVAEGFERFVVHCVARHRSLVSFSKTTPLGTRLTYILLRPSSSHFRPPPPTFPSLGGFSLETPPTTDISGSSIAGGSGTDIDSEVASHSGRWEEDSSASETQSVYGVEEVGPSVMAGSLIVEEAGLEADDDDSSDDESVSSVALLSLASSIASLDLDPAPTPTPQQFVSQALAASDLPPLPTPSPSTSWSSRPSNPSFSHGETSTPRKIVDIAAAGEGEEETPTKNSRESGTGAGGAAGKKGSFWEFLYGEQL